MAHVRKPEQHVLDGGQPPNQRMILKDRRGDAARLFESGCVLKLAHARDRNRAAGWLYQAIQRADQCRLAYARRPNHGGDRALLEAEREIAQYLAPASANREPADRDHGARR